MRSMTAGRHRHARDRLNEVWSGGGERHGQALAARGVPSRGYFALIHTQPYLRPFLPTPPRLPVTEEAARRTLALPFHTKLSLEQQQCVVEQLRSVVEGQ